MQTSAAERYTRIVKEQAMAQGFQYCGISKVVFLEEEAKQLENWLRKGNHGSMKYMENHFDKRLNPALLVPGAKSVISLLLNYYPDRTQRDQKAPKISRYAYGKDYHKVIRKKLKAMVRALEEKIGKIEGRVFVDSAPVMDKVWAKKSGLGWVGKNTNLIHKGSGSYYFIAEIISDLELIADGPVKDYCGSCTRCLDACPTEALTAPYQIDASKCISYFTIELKEAIPEEMKGKWNDWIFGCDICQEVCPWNRFAKPLTETDLHPNEQLLNLQQKEWFEMTEEVFQTILTNSAIHRTGFKGLRRNIRFIRGLPYDTPQ